MKSSTMMIPKSSCNFTQAPQEPVAGARPFFMVMG